LLKAAAKRFSKKIFGEIIFEKSQNHFGVPGVLKKFDLFWATQDSCIASSKLHTLVLTDFFIAVSSIVRHMLLLLPIVAALQKIIPHI
jgi:hypothetical protein